MRARASLAKWDLVRLLIRLEKEGEFGKGLHKDLRKVLREAQRQVKASEAKVKLWHSARKVRERKVKKQEQRRRFEVGRELAAAMIKREEELARKRERCPHRSVEVICGIPLAMESFEEMAKTEAPLL